MKLTLAKYLVIGLTLMLGRVAEAQDPLRSWNDTPTKKAIVTFVERVCGLDSPTFVAPNDRVAVFDNDGTLWAEQPVYFQLQFAFDRLKELAPQHPEWKTLAPFSHLIAGDVQGFMASGEHAIVAALAAAHANFTTEEFEDAVTHWLKTARHPRTHRLYTEMVYQPMLELLSYLRMNHFRTYIVSGGGVDFMRAFAERLYGVPPERVIGSQGKLKFEMRNGQPVLVKLPEVQFVDDHGGKPAGIHTLIGRRPLAAFGNSDGDLEMCQWTAAGEGPRFMLIVHHDDAEREWAYDRKSPVGTLDKAWDEAVARKWTVVSMKNDWKRVFPFDP